jgi:chorismate synthase
VAAGAVAKALLEKRGTIVRGYSLEIAGVRARTIDYDFIEKNSLRAPDPGVYKRMERRVLVAKQQGDSVGGIVEVVVENPPPGLGEPVFDKLEADLAKSLLSIGAIRGFEVGNGFAAARLRGSENNDAIYAEKKTGRIRTRTNRAGGIAGGISNGEPIIVRIAVKPPSSIKKEQETTTLNGKPAKISVEGRHDPCICPRVVPVAEAMVALTLLEHLFRQQLVKRGTRKRALREALEVLDANLTILRSERRAIVKDLTKNRKSV